MKDWYIGVNGAAKKIKAAYIGVEGKAKKVVKGYIGVGGKSKQFYPEDEEQVEETAYVTINVIVPVSGVNFVQAGVSVGDRFTYPASGMFDEFSLSDSGNGYSTFTFVQPQVPSEFNPNVSIEWIDVFEIGKSYTDQVVLTAKTDSGSTLTYKNTVTFTTLFRDTPKPGYYVDLDFWYGWDGA